MFKQWIHTENIYAPFPQQPEDAPFTFILFLILHIFKKKIQTLMWPVSDVNDLSEIFLFVLIYRAALHNVVQEKANNHWI